MRNMETGYFLLHLYLKTHLFLLQQKQSSFMRDSIGFQLIEY